MKYSFHPEAKEELMDAMAYYDSCSPGLGLEFVTEIYSTIQHIIRFPKAWSEFSRHTRRCLTKRFPFGVVYLISEDKHEIVIIAIMQLNREPGYWKQRLK